MTDHKQAPERYSPAMLFSTQKPATMHKELHGEFVTYVAYAALAKQRDELAAAAKVLLDKHDELLKQSKFRTANSFRKTEVLAFLLTLAAQGGE